MRRNSVSFHQSFRSGWVYFWTRLFHLFIDPTFIILTILGNSFVVASGLLFYHIEKPHNTDLGSWLDGVWWSVATVTTVGYGDVIPVTTEGKVLGIFMMLAGTAIFLSFTALFAKAVIGYEIDEVESEVRKLQKEIKKMRNE